jgi:hypothetical protein
MGAAIKVSGFNPKNDDILTEVSGRSGYNTGQAIHQGKNDAISRD